MNVNINTAEVRKTGSDTFPALAEKFTTASFGLEVAQNECAADGLSGSEFLSQWATYNAQIILMLKTSGKHLNACGETLVNVANEHDWTDEDNSHKISEPYQSSYDAEVESQ